MKAVPTIILFALFNVCFGQITTTKVASAKPADVPKLKYDSADNFVGANVHQYIGQELYLTPRSETLQKYGYEGFSLDYTKGTLGNESNVYKCCESHNSKYADLAGKYFKVTEVLSDPDKGDASTKSFLKLQEKESGDVVYYKYDSKCKYFVSFHCSRIF